MSGWNQHGTWGSDDDAAEAAAPRREYEASPELCSSAREVSGCILRAAHFRRRGGLNDEGAARSAELQVEQLIWEGA